MPKITDPRGIQKAYEDSASRLQHAETDQGMSREYIDGGVQSAEDFANDPAHHDLAAGESTSSMDGGSWENNVTGNNKPSGKSTTGQTILRRGGPTALIGGGLIGLSIGASMLLSPSMLLIHIKEVIVDRFSIQNTALEIRANKIVAKKLTSTSTKNCTGLVTIGCKFTRMSNKALQRMADNGIVAVDKNGDPLDLKGTRWGPNQRPYGFINPDGTMDIPVDKNTGKAIVKAANFTDFLQKNPVAMGVFRRAFNPRWEAFWDANYASFLEKIGFGNKSSKITGDTPDEVNESINNDIDNISEDKPLTTTGNQEDGDSDEVKQRNADNQDASRQANDIIDSAGEETTDEIAKKFSGKLKGGSLFLVNLYCFASQDTGKIAKAMRAIQMAQMIKFGLIFLQVADKIKKGDGVAAEASTVASRFTDEKIDKSGKVIAKAATQSDALLYGLTGNTRLNSKTSNYKRWIPGGGLIATLESISNALKTHSATVDNSLAVACKALGSTFGTIAQLAISFTPIGAIMTAAGILITSSPPFQELVASLFKMMAGKMIDSTIANEDFGNAVGIGMIQAIGEGGNAGGMMPMTVDQATSYLALNQQTQLADAQIDRATLSPFDASNPNTFLGSIVTKFIPYAASIQNGPIGTLGAISSMVGATFSSMLTPGAFADDTTSAATLASSCPDKDITDAGAAAGPLCDVKYGIPVNYLESIDPAENATYLEDHGQIDDSGNIVADSDLDKYIKLCARGDGSAGNDEDNGNSSIKDCIVNTDTKGRYAVYYTDNRMRADYDEE